MLSFIFAQKARNAYVAGNREEAFKYYDKAIKFGAGIKTQMVYAYFLLKNGHLEKSKAIFENIFKKKLKPDKQKYVLSNYVLQLWKENKIDEAIELGEDLIREYKSSNLFGTLGYLYILKGDKKRALRFNKVAYKYNNTNI